MTYPAWPAGGRTRYARPMKLLAALAFAGLLGRAAAQTPPPGVSTAAAAEAETLTQNSQVLLDARDRKTALADAEAAVSAGGGADAYAARAEAKLALSRPDDALIDYAEAARRDPARYGEKYRALLAQLQPKRGESKNAAARGVAGISMKIVLGLAAAGVALIVFGLTFLRRKRNAGKSASEL